ncbi:putative bifunctional diguanylate cyclase/phosphodiesterase [Noviherbaspirillum denitrificans]|nr:EAL domain-containing protein [Noviherbaspirillum denitrificans]
MSFFDGLTGLPNRALLQDRLRQALLNAQREDTQVAVLVLDLHDLARINELLGQQVGDQLIMAIAQRWQSVIRAGDTLSRRVSDEFAVVFANCPGACAAGELAQRMLDELSRPFDLNGHEVGMRACIGISLFPEDGHTPEQLLKNADVALNHARECGTGSYQFYREGMNQASMERLLIESSLRLALQRNEFLLHYQPQIELASGCVVGMEALVRWQHPGMGLVSPARFIPIAEENGQIVDIGLWVLRQACMQTKLWSDRGHSGLRVAVNVSARQFSQSSFAADVKEVLAETGLPPNQLELELTESLIMHRTERVILVMHELRDLGVTFSIDDFGTGYSSLAHLKRFPIDKLKIDQSFTRDIGSDEGGTAITRAVIALGQSLRLQVVAEGVETPEQKAFLTEHGCHGMQGYLFSKPLSAGEFGAFLDWCNDETKTLEWQI